MKTYTIEIYYKAFYFFVIIVSVQCSTTEGKSFTVQVNLSENKCTNITFYILPINLIHKSNFINTGNENTKTDAEITHSIPTVSKAKRIIITTDKGIIMGNSYIIKSCIKTHFINSIENNLQANNLSFIQIMLMIVIIHSIPRAVEQKGFRKVV